jgi:cyclopropane fatty-acyl-phospholipid synthase-like methyltransferase
MMPRFDTSQVRHFYDRNTAGFLVTGQSNSALHRAVWGRGVTTRADAFRYIENEIVGLLRDLPQSSSATHVVDLGCGVGGSLSYLAEQLPIRGTGITLSPVQQRVATDRFRAAGYADRLRCLAGDYSALPDDVGQADLAFAIESFVHATDPAAFLAQCRRLLRPGSLLVIADDFLRSASSVDDHLRQGYGGLAARTIARFKGGWRVNTLLSAGELESLAHAAGFVHVRTTDLTPFVEIRRPRDRFVHGVLSLIGWLPLEDTRLGYLVGGSALQTALARGWIGYDLAVFRREP